MKNTFYIFLLILLVSCTSNTIFEKPEDLIPKDTMSLLVQEMSIATSAKFIKNKNFEKSINYMPLVYDRFKIDSIRFQNSNLYYMSKVDEYQQVFEDAKSSLDKRKAILDKLKTKLDSIRKDSIERSKDFKKQLEAFDTIDKNLKVKEGLKNKKIGVLKPNS